MFRVENVGCKQKIYKTYLFEWCFCKGRDRKILLSFYKTGHYLINCLPFWFFFMLNWWTFKCFSINVWNARRHWSFFIGYIEVEKLLLCTFMWVGRCTSQPPVYSVSSSWLKPESGGGQEVSLKFNSESVFLRKGCLGTPILLYEPPRHHISSGLPIRLHSDATRFLQCSLRSLTLRSGLICLIASCGGPGVLLVIALTC